jgi:ribosomal peptide maturation radical SAM protein 1
MICLIDLPFTSIHRPPIGLALLRSVLQRAGFECEIQYANIAFANLIGKTLYETISGKIPHDFLLGDYLFAQCESSIRLGDRRSYADGGPGRFGNIPDWIWDVLPAVKTRAAEFIHQTAKDVVAKQPLFLGLSATFQLAPALHLAASVKQLAPHTPVVIGGGHCDGEMGLAIHQQFQQVDFVCRGEGEELIVALAQALASNDSGSLQRITGLVLRDGRASVAIGGRALNVRQLDDLPVPDYDDWLAAIDGSALGLDRRDLSIPLETSRGCWYGEKNHCTFCGLNGPSLAFRSKSPRRVLSEIRSLTRYGVANVDAVDLILDQSYFETVLPALSELHLGMSLFYEIKANLKKPQVKMLADAGIATIQPGIESLSSPILKLMKKGVSAYQNIRLLKWCMQHAVTAEWNILYGFPSEPAQEYERMAGMLPLLFHLRPPSVGCNRVLLNRFSPLHFDADRLGVRNVRPVPGYESAYGVPPEASSAFAYYFDFDFDDGRDPETYVVPLKKAVSAWQKLVGHAMLASISVGKEICIFDTRPCAKEKSYRLTGAAARAYQALDAGVAPSALAACAGTDDATAGRLCEEFIANNLALEVDGRLLALAVSLDAWVVPGTAESLWEPVCSLVYQRLATRAWDACNAQTSVPASMTIDNVWSRT